MRILAIDAGTTGITALVFDDEQNAVANAAKEFTQSYPAPGRVEHDATEIWTVTQDVAATALRRAKVQAPDAIGITNQRETVVAWDRETGEPLCPAIVWQDRRTSPRCEALAPEAEWVRKKTGLVMDPYFSAAKMEWILQNVPEAAKAARAGSLAFGTIDSWLTWKLTGEHVTDDTNASRTMLMDLRTGTYDPKLLDLFGLAKESLPRIVASSGEFGDAKAFDAPVAGLVGDQQAALFGQGCIEPGQAKNTYGTGCFLLQHTGREPTMSDHGLLTTRAASTDGTPRFALEGSVFVGGAVVQWLRDGLKIIDSSAAINDRAAEGEDNGGVVVVPAFTGLGAPHWAPDARGAILGLTRGTTRRHIARAALESIAFQSADLLDAMHADTGLALPELRVDGGATRSDLLMQFQADVIGRPVLRTGMVESTALGAARLAGLALGGWSLSDLAEPPGSTRFEPQAGAHIATARQRWAAAVQAVRGFKP